MSQFDVNILVSDYFKEKNSNVCLKLTLDITIWECLIKYSII